MTRTPDSCRQAASVLTRLDAVSGVLPALQDALRDDEVGIRQTARAVLWRYEDDRRGATE